MNVVLKPEDFDSARQHLRKIPGAANKAIALSINYGLRKARTLMQRAIREHYAIKLKDLNRAMPASNTRWATQNFLTGALNIRGPRIPAFAFSPEPRPGSVLGKHSRRNKGKKISVEIEKGQRKVMKVGSYYNPGKVLTIMKRGQPKRYPVKPVTTISVALMADAKKIMPEVSEESRDLVGKELARQVDRFLTPEKK